MSVVLEDKWTRYRSAGNKRSWWKYAAFAVETTVFWSGGMVERVRFRVWPVAAPDNEQEFGKRKECEDWLELVTGHAL